MKKINNIKNYKPTTSGRRGMTGLRCLELSKKLKRNKKLIKFNQRHVGRSLGKVSTRHKGAGHKRLYRLVDFKQDKIGVAGKVVAIQYDPNRSARIALIHYADGDKRFILAPVDLKVGSQIMAGSKTAVASGNRIKLTDMPVGSLIHNIELNPGQGGKLVRGAGTVATLLSKEGKFAIVQLPSKETRKINLACMASVGVLSNPDHNNVTIGKAGRNRWLGIRPTVRGKVMSPADHPHGGGEGVNPIGLKYPKTPWGKPALGKKTRRNKKTDKFIISRRKKRKK